MYSENSAEDELVKITHSRLEEPIDYSTQLVSGSFVFLDTMMADSDCSEDFDGDPFY